jgi:hypothetical protein
MGKGLLTGAVAALATGLLTPVSVLATPTCNDTADAQGCINLVGGKGVFDISASFKVPSTMSGTFTYADTAAGIQVTSSTLVDYSVLDPNVRAFAFNLSGGSYSQARVFLMDNGASGDQIRVQLFSNGFLVYDTGGMVTGDCGPGITIVSDCSSTPEPNPSPEPKPKPEPKPRRPKGNNGVGNGIDPQPPGNPPINDGPGTSPGNPGNRQLGRRR